MKPIADDYRPEVNPDLTTTWIEDELVVLNEAREQVHKLNESAAYLLELCRSGNTVGGIKSKFSARYELEREVVEEDAHELLATLFDLDLIS